MLREHIYKVTPVIVLIGSVVVDLLGILERLLEAIAPQVRPDHLIFIKVYYYSLLVAFSITIWISFYISKKSSLENIDIFRTFFGSYIANHFRLLRESLADNGPMAQPTISLISPDVFYFQMQTRFQTQQREEIYWSNFSPYDLRERTHAGSLHNNIFSLVRDTDNIFSYAVLLDRGDRQNNAAYIKDLIKACRLGTRYKDNVSIIVIPAERYTREISVQVFVETQCILLYKFEPDSLGKQMEMALRIVNATPAIMSFFKTYWEHAARGGLRILHDGVLDQQLMKDLRLC